MTERGQDRGERKQDPPAADQDPPFPCIGQDAQPRLNQVADDRGQAEQQSDLQVRQPQVGPDQRPGSFLPAVYQLVQELDGQEGQQVDGKPQRTRPVADRLTLHADDKNSF